MLTRPVSSQAEKGDTVSVGVIYHLSQTLCFHLGMTEGFVKDYGTPAEIELNPDETKQILQEIYHQITRESGKFIYSHKVREGGVVL